MLNAKKRFIEEMKLEAEAYMYNISSAIAGFNGECAAKVMGLYPVTAEKGIVQMTLIACQKHPEAFCQFVISDACATILLDPKNDPFLISGGKLSPSGQAIMDLFKSVLKNIAADSTTPSGKHNTMRLEFVQKQLAARMR